MASIDSVPKKSMFKASYLKQAPNTDVDSLLDGNDSAGEGSIKQMSADEEIQKGSIDKEQEVKQIAKAHLDTE